MMSKIISNKKIMRNWIKVNNCFDVLENIEKELQTNSYKKKFLGNERLFYEDLSIWELSV